MTEREDILRLLGIHTRRLQTLRERAAQYGIATPVEVLTEIKDIESEINELEDRVNRPISPSPSRQKVYHNLPQKDYENFVGRQKELGKIHETLLPYPRSRYHVLTIDGIGGIGKSALALEVANHYLRNADTLPAEERFDAIIWVSAKKTMLTGEGIKRFSYYMEYLDDIYTSIAVTLGRKDITRARDKERHELVKHALTHQRTLLIIDNLETIDDESVISFIKYAPEPTKIIITTRHWMSISETIRLRGMSEEDALALIHDESKKKNLLLSKTDAHQLCDRTGGVPLAIVWSISQMADGYGCETVLKRLGQPTNDIIEFCFEGAAERIRDRAAFKLLMAITLFSRDASREALGFTTGLSEYDRDDGLVELEKLSLINKSGNRFQILPLTLIFSKTELSKYIGLEEELRIRCVFYYNDYLSEHGQCYESLDDIKLEMDNIIGVMDWCLETGKLEEYIDLLQKMNFYLWATGNWSSWSRYLKAGPQIAATLGQDIAQADFYDWNASMRYYQDDLNDSEDLIGKAINIYHLYNNKASLAQSIRRLASIQIKRGLEDVARNNLEFALELAQQENNKRIISRIHRQLAKLDIQAGDLTSAEIRLHSARELREQETQLSSGLAYIYKLLGQVSQMRQHYSEANHYFQRSLEIGERIGSQHDIADAKQSLAELAFIGNQKNKAETLILEAIDGFDKLGMKLELRKAQELLERIRN